MSTSNGKQPQDLDKIADLIRKCLALSSSSNESEAILAFSKAQQLLEKYNLSMQDVVMPEDFELAEAEMVYSYLWIPDLYKMCAKHNFCRTVGHPWKDSISVLGRKVNVFATFDLASWLQPQLEHFCSVAYLETNHNLGRNKFRNSFMAGAIARIDARLEIMFGERKIQNSSLTALVVSTKEENNVFVGVRYPHLVSGRARHFSYEGYAAGQAAGDQVGIVRPGHHLDGGPLRLNGGQ